MPIKMNVNYFAHDYGARYNPKLMVLQMSMGSMGLALFWCLVEMLWENAGYYPCVYDTIAFHLHWPEAEDVRRVVEDFDLFHSDGKVFWSDTVLERMEKRQKISEDRAKSGKAGGIQSGKSRRKKAGASETRSSVEAPASTTGSSREAAASTPRSTREATASKEVSTYEASASTLRSKERNKEKKVKKEINKKNTKEENVEKEEDEKYSILELFFFKNFISPEYELNRFWGYYTRAKWTTGDGQAITNKIRVAGSWKPEKSDRRFDSGFLEWYKTVFAEIKRNKVMENPYEMLSGIVRVVITDQGHQLLISFKTKELAEKVRSFVLDNNLSGGYVIDWNFAN